MAEGIGTGLLSRKYAGSNPAGDATKMSLVMRLASQRHCLWRETGSIPVRGADDSSRVMRLVPQRYCLWRETGSIPVRGTHGVQSHGDQGASKTPREGSIPSRPAVRESFFSSVLNEGQIRGVVLHLQCGTRGATPRCSTVSRIDSKGAIVQQENPAIAMRRSGCDSPSLHHLAEPGRRSRSGAIAQPGERLDGIEEVAGATPAGSTDHELE